MMILRRAAAGLLKRFSFQSQARTACRGTTNCLPLMLPSKKNLCSRYISQGHGYRGQTNGIIWILASGQAAALIFGIGSCSVLAEDSSTGVNSESGKGIPDMTGLQRVEDGSVVSNEHTAKWRIFTDNGREFFMKGKLHEAERFFLSAVDEAKIGFGERDPHVASAYNNLAELYRVKKAYDKAEPLYLEAIEILKESFGPEDLRLGAAFHNLGQFYLVQRKLEEARASYERSLKIKGRVLGQTHTDYADTMYHLGTVLYLLGKQKDAKVLIQNSIQILEERGLGESPICIKRLQYLAKICLNSKELKEAESIRRKILHIMEVTKGWNSLDTVIAAELLAMTLVADGSLHDARELLERCLDVRRLILPENHIQIGGNMLSLARVAMLNADQLMLESSAVTEEIDRARDLLLNSIRIAQGALDALISQKRSVATGNDGRTAFFILLQAFRALSRLEMTKQKLLPSEGVDTLEAENALNRCISAFKKYGSERPTFASKEAKSEYLKCMKRLRGLLKTSAKKQDHQSGSRASVDDLDKEIKRVEAEVSEGNR